MNMTRKRIASGKILESKNISTEKWAAGLYFVKIRTTTSTQVLKLVRY